MTNCRFCQLKKEDYNRVIKETDNFFTIPTLGQFVEGYLLIIPKNHYTCFGALPDNLLKEYSILKKEIGEIYELVYEKPIYFEHGPPDSNKRGGCCVDHAHMHVIPKNINLVPEIARHFNVQKLKYITELRTKYRNGANYLFFENTEGEMYACDVDLVPSQYLRQVIAIKLGMNDKWDWRQYPFFHNIKKCQERLTEVCLNGLKIQKD
ncbi:HIT domain-containing protein [Candidatus Woesearchaeota archaeon]|nr:HIT domain-containing protein [Candidatus Woesearchaeota archaeon]